MNRLVIIGNGFDLAHHLHTSYKDFIDWYWKQKILELSTIHDRLTEDSFCRLINFREDWHLFAYRHGFFRLEDPLAIKDMIEECNGEYSVNKFDLFDRITQNIASKGWTDIERDYYELLKKNAESTEVCKRLNDQMKFAKEKLAEYLSTIQQPNTKETIKKALDSPIYRDDVSTHELKRKENELRDIPEEEFIKIEGSSDISYGFVENTMLLNFNYTPTAEMYLEESIRVNYIHGSLGNPKEMIFGYGDEMDKDFKDLENRNENALLENSKSIKYLETSHYRDLLSFIEGGPFQVYIMGHSCGNSDRTLLNTIFEHQNCISIKPFCYINDNGEDNYSELTRNIYRNFTDKKLFRDRVVNKERCTTLDGKPLVGKEQLASQ